MKREKYSFLAKFALTKMANIKDKMSASIQNHEKQQTKILAQDMFTSSHSKSWYGLDSFFKELPISSFGTEKLHLMQLFTSFFWDAVEVQLKTKTFYKVHELSQKIKESVKKIFKIDPRCDRLL